MSVGHDDAVAETEVEAGHRVGGEAACAVAIGTRTVRSVRFAHGPSPARMPTHAIRDRLDVAEERDGGADAQVVLRRRGSR